MSLPETCPFCGAGVHGMSGDWVSFRCHTMTQTVADRRQFQSRTCKDAERARLAARVAALEAENKALRDRFSDADTERNAAQAGLKDTFIRAAKLEARCKQLEEAMELVAQMRQRWLEREDDGYAGAYYAFVKGKDDEWNAIMQAKEAK